MNKILTILLVIFTATNLYLVVQYNKLHNQVENYANDVIGFKNDVLSVVSFEVSEASNKLDKEVDSIKNKAFEMVKHKMLDKFIKKDNEKK